MTFLLTSPGGALKSLSGAFRSTGQCRIQVREDGAFAQDHYFDLGEVVIAGSECIDAERALRYGEFEWTVPDVESARASLEAAMGGTPTAAEMGKMRRLLDALGGVAIRLGLSHPVLDPLALAAMPFRRPTTVVSDTSGVLQGGLSFVARYLHPAARLKIPAVVQMEIVNSSDRFLSNRRKKERAKKYDLLFDHVNSQAAQRVLLQLELRSSVELERTFLLGDPLRAAFKSDDEKELKELNLSVPVRSYADRLILEAARQHQTQVSPGHPVLLLTSDQGLARMAITEGLQPLYFRAAKAEALFGRTHTGSNLRPFDGQLVGVGIAEVLWELATIFGTARLTDMDGLPKVTVHAIGEELAWAPYQSQDDLLWIEQHPEPAPTISVGIDLEGRETSAIAEDVDLPPRGLREKLRARQEKEVDVSEEVPNLGDSVPAETGRLTLFKMRVETLLKLVEALDREQMLTEAQVASIADAHKASALSDYRRFLVSGGALKVDGDEWQATGTLHAIAAAVANSDATDLGEALTVIPAYASLREALRDAPEGEPYPAADAFKRAEKTFVTLAEVTLIGATVYDQGFFPTGRRPSDEEFVPLALTAYAKLSPEGGWASTGQWLEEMIAVHGVHPIIARSRLQSSAERGLIERSFEGSTTDTKLDRHAIKVLSTRSGSAYLATEYLYRGDFLMPGRGGSSLRILEAGHESA